MPTTKNEVTTSCAGNHRMKNRIAKLNVLTYQLSSIWFKTCEGSALMITRMQHPENLTSPYFHCHTTLCFYILSIKHVFQVPVAPFSHAQLSNNAVAAERASVVWIAPLVLFKQQSLKHKGDLLSHIDGQMHTEAVDSFDMRSAVRENWTSCINKWVDKQQRSNLLSQWFYLW